MFRAKRRGKENAVAICRSDREKEGRASERKRERERERKRKRKREKEKGEACGIVVTFESVRVTEWNGSSVD